MTLEPLSNMRMRKETSAILVLISLISAFAGYTDHVAGDPGTYREEAPPEISGGEFPEVVSYFDRRGVLWVFWREDSAIHYTNITDTARWDITTSYKDFMGRGALDSEKPSPISMVLALGLGILISLGTVIGYLYRSRKVPIGRVRKNILTGS